MKYLVIMPYSWGRGDSIAEAEKNARKEGSHGRKKVKRVCFQYNTAKTSDCFVDSMGSLCWTGEKPEKVELE